MWSFFLIPIFAIKSFFLNLEKDKNITTYKFYMLLYFISIFVVIFLINQFFTNNKYSEYIGITYILIWITSIVFMTFISIFKINKKQSLNLIKTTPIKLIFILILPIYYSPDFTPETRYILEEKCGRIWQTNTFIIYHIPIPHLIYDLINWNYNKNEKLSETNIQEIIYFILIFTFIRYFFISIGIFLRKYRKTIFHR